MLHEALTGSTPFPGLSHQQAMAAHLSSPPPRPSAINPRVPASFDDVIARGMAKEPDDRYGSAGALGRAALRALRADARSAAAGTSMAGPTAAAAPPGPVPFDPRWRPGMGGPAGTDQQGPEYPSRAWLLPTVIGVAATLLLSAVGVIIVLLVNQKGGPAPSPSPTTGDTAAPTSYQGSAPPTLQQAPTLAPPPPPTAVTPPLITGPDNTPSHESCDFGYSLNNASGWGSHAGRGTQETSCFFAASVLTSYWDRYGNASRQARTVSAPGAVQCSSAEGELCDGSNYVMQCVAYPSDNWITCTGGKNARVYLF